MIELRNPYPEVLMGGTLSYGGNQMQAEGRTMQQCGCGIVAALDLSWYLKRYHSIPATDWQLVPTPLREYNEKLALLNRQYFPLIPRLGINGLLLVAGINRMFQKEAISYRAKWVISGNRLWERVREMLLQDLPVIMSVGPNFPAVWQKNRLDFYRRLPSGEYRKAAATTAHYVTATGIDDEWLKISSWGKQYYINRKEYKEYVKKHSTYLFSNIVYLEKR